MCSHAYEWSVHHQCWLGELPPGAKSATDLPGGLVCVKEKHSTGDLDSHIKYYKAYDEITVDECQGALRLLLAEISTWGSPEW